MVVELRDRSGMRHGGVLVVVVGVQLLGTSADRPTGPRGSIGGEGSSSRRPSGVFGSESLTPRQSFSSPATAATMTCQGNITVSVLSGRRLSRRDTLDDQGVVVTVELFDAAGRSHCSGQASSFQCDGAELVGECCLAR